MLQIESTLFSFSNELKDIDEWSVSYDIISGNLRSSGIFFLKGVGLCGRSTWLSQLFWLSL